MKKALLSVGTLFLVGTVACGPQDTFTDEEPGPLQVAEAGLTLRSCTPLPVSSMIASGSEAINPPAHTTDDRLDTRWSNLGQGSWIDYDLGSNRTISGVAIAWHQGNTRTNNFAISVSSDGMVYTQIHTGTSSGTTAEAETYTFSPRTTRRVRIRVNGNSVNDWASISEARVCSGESTTPPASVVWSGNFETGDRSQWSGAHMVSADRMQLVSSPRREGNYALKVTVRQGDNPINASGNRNELYRMTREPVGSEYFYRWSTMFATDFPAPKTWQVFAQWHHEGNSGSPPVEFVVNNERISLNCSGTQVWSAPLVRGAWQDFVFHTKWSSNASVGFVELYHNGQLVLPKRYCATQYSGMLNYLKMGLYRNSTIAPVGVLYHDGWTMGRQLSDVLPAGATLSSSVAAVASASDE
ncbi:heparin lyase I family protein [Hyalangium gracile]|uniref:heparin lyase I family protein n=1 Tax=Hyalangium gracile TaxID=394092 RepID=UPI001CCD555A|nr:heparin lyase I family protein [Hyalangium gracile]